MKIQITNHQQNSVKVQAFWNILKFKTPKSKNNQEKELYLKKDLLKKQKTIQLSKMVSKISLEKLKELEK
jgi:hypothetical protein